MAQHYVAEITITRVMTSIDDLTPASSRQKATVARIVVSGAELPALTDKVGKHLELVEDGGSIGEGKTR